jgi:uncharacterized membrane protein
MKYFKFDKTVFLIIAIFSLTGLFASFVLTVEKINLLKDSSYALSCDINSILNCGSVMKSKYAEFHGIPNPLFGVIGYTVMLTLAVYYLFHGVIRKSFLSLALLGSFGAFGFSYFLLYASVFKLGTLCPYCLLSAVSATNIFFSFLIYSLKVNLFNLKESTYKHLQMFIRKGWYMPIAVIWYISIIATIVLKISQNS